MTFKCIKQKIINFPVLGPLLVDIANFIGYKKRSKPYSFVREVLPEGGDQDNEREYLQVINLLNYTKTSGSFYAAANYPAGYHTLNILGRTIKGRRSPRERLNLVDYNFKDKTVLDIGSNQGGMLFQLKSEIKWGVGIDYDSRMINASLKIKAIEGYHHLHFFHFDLEKEPLELIRDFLPGGNVDIVFLLAMCRWIKNWRQVITFAANISPVLFIELNSVKQREKEEQKKFLQQLYEHVALLSGSSSDDAERTDRQFYLCKK